MPIIPMNELQKWCRPYGAVFCIFRPHSRIVNPSANETHVRMLTRNLLERKAVCVIFFMFILADIDDLYFTFTYSTLRRTGSSHQGPVSHECFFGPLRWTTLLCIVQYSSTVACQTSRNPTLVQRRCRACLRMGNQVHRPMQTDDPLLRKRCLRG